MNSNPITAVATLTFAALYPTYWVFALIFGADHGSIFAAFKADLQQLNLWDALFLLVGALEVFVYLRLRRVLRHRLHTETCQILALLMALCAGVFTTTVLVDVALAAGFPASESFRSGLLVTTALASISLMVVMSFIGILLGFFLVAGRAEMPALLKVFAGLLLLSCLLNFTVIFSFLSLAAYPLAMVSLAAYFLQGDQEVEVV